MMPSQLQDVIDQGLRVLVSVIVPTLLIPVAGILSAALQGMMGIREEGLQYAVRALACVGVVVVFGSGAARAFAELLQLALR